MTYVYNNSPPTRSRAHSELSIEVGKDSQVLTSLFSAILTAIKATILNQVCSQDTRMRTEFSLSTSGVSGGECCCRAKHADDWSPRDTHSKTCQRICLILMLLLTVCITSTPSIVYFTIRVSEFKIVIVFSRVLIFPVDTFSFYSGRTFLPQNLSLHTVYESRTHASVIITLYD